MHDRSEWTQGPGGAGRKGNLTMFSRPCVTCGKPFAIYVNEKIASGKADSNSFGLKNCEEHRKNNRPAKRDLEAEVVALRARDTAMSAEIQQLKAQVAAYELFRK